MSSVRLYLGALLVALISWGVATLVKQTDVEEMVAIKGGAEYFSRGYKKIEMGENGLPESILTASKMTHFSQDGRTHLEQPFMLLNNQDGSPWNIQSETGVVSAEGDALFLQGKVEIKRNASRSTKALLVNTSDLHVTLSEDYAETREWAEIISRGNRTQGVGMQVTFKQPVHLKFLRKVKGRYSK